MEEDGVILGNVLIWGNVLILGNVLIWGNVQRLAHGSGDPDSPAPLRSGPVRPVRSGPLRMDPPDVRSNRQAQPPRPGLVWNEAGMYFISPSWGLQGRPSTKLPGC